VEIKCEMRQEGLKLLADKNNTGDVIRVFAYLCLEMDESGYVDITQALIAENMDITAEQVSKSISALMKLGAVVKQYHDTKGRTLNKVVNSFANKDFKWLMNEDDIDWVKREGGGYLD
jgi:predicted transcriptional regulator